ncbi:MAG TPA: hypothetical protein PKW99_13685, partial [Thauera sp.]|nr:hypothetical protein [Thauera sp.]
CYLPLRVRRIAWQLWVADSTTRSRDGGKSISAASHNDQTKMKHAAPPARIRPGGVRFTLARQAQSGLDLVDVDSGLRAGTHHQQVLLAQTGGYADAVGRVLAGHQRAV